jgi:hypothetical protein
LNLRNAVAVLFATLTILGILALPATAAAPVVSIEDATNVTATTADVEGTVNPEGQFTNWRFQYATAADFSNAQDGPSGSTETTETVSGTLEKLLPNTTYHLRLLANNGDGQSEAVAANSFKTPGSAPLVKTFAAGPIHLDQADLNGEVDPRNAPTTYWFEWGTENCSDGGCTATAPLPAAADEEKKINVLATAGEFTLTFEGVTTGDLPTNATAAAIQTALEALPGIGAGNVSVSGTFATDGFWHYRVAFRGDLAKTNVGPLVAAEGSSPLTSNEGQSGGNVTVTDLVKGGFDQGYAFFFHHLDGLQSQTTYHFRLVAENAFGTTAGDDEEFTTLGPEPPCANAGLPGADTLPDCRAYELVSPPEKKGQDVNAQSSKTFSSADGNGVSYEATGAFNDDVKGVQGGVQYISRRSGAPGTNGWSTKAITPLSGSQSIQAIANSNIPSFEAGFTPDLGDGIYSAWRPLTDNPNGGGVTNLYRLRDLEADDTQATLLSAASTQLAPVPPPYPASVRTVTQIVFDGASTDLSHVIFQSPWDLEDGSYLLLEGAYSGDLYEYADGAGTRRVGRIPAGGAVECDDLAGPACVDAPTAQAGISSSPLIGGSQYSAGMISDDGSRILFQTPAGAGQGTLYLREDGHRTIQVNVSEKTFPESPGAASAWEMTPDGNRIFFSTDEGLVDGDKGGLDLYMYDRTKPEGSRLTRITTNAAGDPCQFQAMIGASRDGDSVYFYCSGQLIPGRPFAQGGMYLWRDGDLSYLGKAENVNLIDENSFRTAWQFASNVKQSRLTPDGGSLLFAASTDEGLIGEGGFAGYDQQSTCPTGACTELYLYNSDTGRLLCATCNPRAASSIAVALTDVSAAKTLVVMTQHQSQALSEDGRYVFFNTTEALVEEDTNGVFDAYEYDAQRGEVHLLSSGTDKDDSYFLDASPDGRDVFIVTRERLVGWDVDGSYDLYDARVGGGFAEPRPTPAPCRGESCLPGVGTPPQSPATASENQGSGNPKPSCPKGKRRVVRHGRARCVKRKRHNHHKQHNHQRRDADKNGRAGH